MSVEELLRMLADASPPMLGVVGLMFTYACFIKSNRIPHWMALTGFLLTYFGILLLVIVLT